MNGTAFRSSVRKTNQKRKEPENSGESVEETEQKKPKAKPKEPKIATFPMERFVNKYHFMRVGPDVLNALGWKISGDRLAVELDLKDGVLIVRKA
jgi:hypothetical protein